MDLIDVYRIVRGGWVAWGVLLFVGMIWWVMRPSGKAGQEAAARIPLEEEDSLVGANASSRMLAPARDLQ
jgi:cbb3-type cytochrome oxidase subunit 3